jgi:hypothetical protein
MTDATLTRHDLEAKIVKRCWEDEAFRKEFISDPVGAFVRYLGVPATDLPKIVIHEESAGSWHIVLPTRQAEAGELSEADLEKISGGSKGSVPGVCFADEVALAAAQAAKLSLVSKVASGVSAVIASGIGSLIAGQNIDTGW